MCRTVKLALYYKGEEIKTGGCAVGLLAGLGVALVTKLPRYARITGAALGAVSGLGLGYQIHASRKQAAMQALRDVWPPVIPEGLKDAVASIAPWEQLPVFDFGDKKRDNIDWIKGDQMSDPVMNGSDAHGRPCLLIRYKPRDLDAFFKPYDQDWIDMYRPRIEEGKYPVMSIFFRHIPGTGEPKDWLAYGNNPFNAITPFEGGSGRGGWNYDGVEAHAELKAFIETGGNKDYELV